MADSNTYSFSTISGTNSGVTNTSSTGSSSSSTGVTTIVQTSSPDDSDGMSASLGGSAVALGTDTLTAGSLSGTLVDGGSATTADLSASMVGASQSPSGTAFASAETSAGVLVGPDVLIGVTVNSASSTQNAAGSSAIATSTTKLAAIDIHAPTSGGGTENDLSAPVGYAQADLDLDGNIALIEFDAIAVGDDTFVGVDAFVLAVEDELSLSGGLAELAVG
jgi:hypothetical protein